MQQESKKSRWMLILSMCIFGTVGIFRKYIPLSSGVVALSRAVIGTIFLLLVTLARKRTFSLGAIRKNLPMLLFSGAALGFNWILLFESYNHTTVATATLCYYLAPILVIIVSALFFKEKLTTVKSICTAIALAGMVLVSGILEGSSEADSDMTGILFGLGAAMLYACVMLLNRRIQAMDAFDKTVVQLSVSALVLIPYVLLSEDLSTITFAPETLALLAAVGIIHTGIAYCLYFGAIGNLPSQTAALLSYLDPVLAILLSVTLLHEPMSIGAAVGAILILGSAIVSEQAG